MHGEGGNQGFPSRRAQAPLCRWDQEEPQNTPPVGMGGSQRLDRQQQGRVKVIPGSLIGESHPPNSTWREEHPNPIFPPPLTL